MGKLKLNVDASWFIQAAGIGGVLHNHEGQVRLMFTKVLSHSPSPEYAKKLLLFRKG